MNKLTIISDSGDEKITYIKEGSIAIVKLDDVLEVMEIALKAMGFSFDGHLTIVNEVVSEK